MCILNSVLIWIHIFHHFKECDSYFFSKIINQLMCLYAPISTLLLYIPFNINTKWKKKQEETQYKSKDILYKIERYYRDINRHIDISFCIISYQDRDTYILVYIYNISIQKKMSFSLHSRSGSTKSKTLNGPSHDEWLRQKEREKVRRGSVKWRSIAICWQIIYTIKSVVQIWLYMYVCVCTAEQKYDCFLIRWIFPLVYYFSENWKTHFYIKVLRKK